MSGTLKIGHSALVTYHPVPFFFLTSTFCYLGATSPALFSFSCDLVPMSAFVVFAYTHLDHIRMTISTSVYTCYRYNSHATSMSNTEVLQFVRTIYFIVIALDTEQTHYQHFTFFLFIFFIGKPCHVFKAHTPCHVCLQQSVVMLVTVF